MISTSRTSDFQISGSAISSHKNIHRGIDANISIQEVKKMNESYEAVTVTPEGSNIGVNINLDEIYVAHDKFGIDYETCVDRIANVAQNGINNQPAIDVASLTDYDQMKDKLIMEVVSAEYYVAAEPPVRCGESHHSGQTEPPCY